MRVELSDVSKYFGGLCALDGVSLHLGDGEVVALVGDNGAGKSTLIRIISGVHAPDGGSLVIDGEPVNLHSPNAARRNGIETVHQNLAVADNLDVAANLFLGRELTRGPLRRLDKRRMRRRAAEILDGFSIHVPSVRSLMRELSGGQRQGVAIGRAIGWGSRLIVMDEPTAALGVQETARVEELVHRMRIEGLGILIVSHNLEQVFRVSNRIYVLRRGQLVGEVETAKTHGDEVVSLITGLKRSEVTAPPAAAPG